jgi:hypothetical protein
VPFYTDTSQVRGNALDFVGLTDLSIRRSTSFFSVMTSQLLKDAPSGSPLRVIAEIDSISSTNQRSASAETDQQEALGRRCSSPKWILPPDRRYTSEPVGVRCDGWCMPDFKPCATVVSAVCAWRDGRQTLMLPSRLRHTDSCLYRHARTRSALGKAHGVRSRPCCAASSVSAPCSNMALFLCYEPDWHLVAAKYPNPSYRTLMSHVKCATSPPYCRL